jgi:hypothetical protein
MPRDAVNTGKSRLLQQPMQRVGVTVNVTNEIGSLFDQSARSLGYARGFRFCRPPLSGAISDFISGSEPS